MNYSKPEVYNLIKIINSLPEKLIKSSQTGSNPKWITHKVNAIQRYLASDEIDSKSKLWKKLTNLEVYDPINTVGIPEISTFEHASWLDNWSGVMEITEARIITYLANDLQSAGVIFKDISSAFYSNQDSVEELLSSPEENTLDRLNAMINGLANHGFFLSVPEALRVERPFKIIVKVTGKTGVLPLIYVTKLENRSSTKIVVEYISEAGNNGPCFIPVIHSEVLGKEAELEMIEIQEFEKSNFLFPIETIEIGEKAVLNRFILDKGSQVTSRAFSADLNESGGSAFVTGVYLPKGGQKFFYDTRQNHMASDTTSSLLFKGVLDDKAFTLWKGNVLVKEGVRRADGYQLNNTLLLNPSTHAESIPGLEISTDDVKCSHGVTLSSVDKDQLFYLQTRGIDEKEGKGLIVDGFIRAAISRIKSIELQDYVQEKMDEGEPVF